MTILTDAEVGAQLPDPVLVYVGKTPYAVVIGRDQNAAKVSSKSGGKPHLINSRGDCNCDYFRFSRGRTCNHQRALTGAQERERQTQKVGASDDAFDY